MHRPSKRHHVFIVNEKQGEPIAVTPEYLPVARGDDVIFQVVGEKGAFQIRPSTDVFEPGGAGEHIAVERGLSPVRQVRRDVPIGSVHRYEIVPQKGENYDPVFIIYR